jgi:hypothetical protein
MPPAQLILQYQLVKVKEQIGDMSSEGGQVDALEQPACLQVRHRPGQTRTIGFCTTRKPTGTSARFVTNAVPATCMRQAKSRDSICGDFPLVNTEANLSDLLRPHGAIGASLPGRLRCPLQ